MIYHHSTERIGVTRNYLILDVFKAINKAAMEYLHLFKFDVDAEKYKDGWLVNSLHALGQEVTTKRIQQYEKALEGEFDDDVINYKTRWTYFYHVNSLCYVCEEDVDFNFSKQKCYVCSCETFWKELSCPHAVLFQYQTELSTRAYKIPMKRRAFLVKEKKAALLLSTKTSTDKASTDNTEEPSKKSTDEPTNTEDMESRPNMIIQLSQGDDI
jgi:hypothetical protein